MQVASQMVKTTVKGSIFLNGLGKMQTQFALKPEKYASLTLQPACLSLHALCSYCVRHQLDWLHQYLRASSQACSGRLAEGKKSTHSLFSLTVVPSGFTPAARRRTCSDSELLQKYLETTKIQFHVQCYLAADQCQNRNLDCGIRDFSSFSSLPIDI